MFTLDWNIIWTFVNILVLFLFLKLFLFGPVTEIMEKRKQTISNSLDEAEATKMEALQIKKNYETELSNAGLEAVSIVNQARDRADIEYNNKILEAKEEALRIIQDANKTIELERKKSIQIAQSEIAGIALLAASKVIGKNVDENTNKQMLGDFLKEVGASK